ncbi:MAG: glycosyltransferase family 4 protein [Candidatus Micrarchaeaceae archaeon]
MKLAFAYESAYPWFNGGIEKRRYNILKALSKSKSMELHMFTLYRPGMPGYEFEYEGVKYHCIGKASGIAAMYANGSRRNVYMSAKFAVALFAKLLRHRFDAIDTDSFPFLHVPLVYIYARLTGARLLLTWHEVWSRSFWHTYLPKGGALGYFFERLAARLGDAHIANSSATKDLLTDLFGVSSEKVIIFPAAVDKEEVDAFAKANAQICSGKAKQDKFVVVSRLVKHKRVELAINAIAHTKAKLVVIGKGPELLSLKTLAKPLGANKVVFRPSVSPTSLYRELCTSKGLVMPSEREGLSLITVEALSIGVPVIIVESSMLPKELKSLCVEASDGGLAAALNDVSAHYYKYARKYAKLAPYVIRRFSNEGAEKIYRKALRA